MPPVEAWEKVWIDIEQYGDDVHAFINCTVCHGGESVDDMELAHTDLVLDPTSDPEVGCGTCHPDITPHAAESLHNTLTGYDTAIYERSSPEHFDSLEEMESYHCEDCHATCGDCHISQPNSVGGGLLEGHAFVSTPPMSRTCTACHGSRVKNEYFGLNEGFPGDVHLRQARLACTDCHTSAEMHGIGPAGEAAHRYDDPETPECEDCHADEVGVGSDIVQHQIHGTEILSCQVCHSVSYTNCTNCHVDRTEDDIPYYSIEDHSMGFYLGRNVLQSNERPYRYVPVRHVPIDPNSFDVYGDDLLDNFLNRPTWAYATPHNIQKNTPQTETCTSCHGNDDLFLTPDKVVEAERNGANLAVIVAAAPPLPEGYEEYLTPEELEALPVEQAAPAGDDAGDASFWGDGSSTDNAADTEEDDAGDASFWGGDVGSTDDTADAGDEADSAADTSPESETGTGVSNNPSFWANN